MGFNGINFGKLSIDNKNCTDIPKKNTHYNKGHLVKYIYHIILKYFFEKGLNYEYKKTSKTFWYEGQDGLPVRRFW